jgi:hypothetical protein
MSGRPVRRRVLADVEQRGGWPAVLQRIENGESVTQIAGSFNVSRGFFTHLLHEDRERHDLVIRTRNVPMCRSAKPSPRHLAVRRAGGNRGQRDAGTGQIAREVSRPTRTTGRSY